MTRSHFDAFRWACGLAALATGAASFGADDLRPIPLKARIENVQPMTGMVLWSTNARVVDSPIQLEYSYLGYDQVVRDRGTYDWKAVEDLLNAAASRKHQMVLRWYDVYVGKPSRIPAYIQNDPAYQGVTAPSEKKPTGFPDWSHPELPRFTLEFFDRFAERYDDDPRLAFVQVGFGLWSEYHIYDGPMTLGKTFPSREFQAKFAERLTEKLRKTPWMISVDAAGDHAPFADSPRLLALPFGVFDDSFNHATHKKENEPNWNALNRDRWKIAPAGGEFSFFEKKDQTAALAPDGPHGESFDRQAARFHLSFIIADAQPRHQKPERIREAGMACGYRFRISRFASTPGRSIVVVENVGVAPIYHDAFPAVDGVRSPTSLKGLPPGESRTFEIPAGDAESLDAAPRLTIESDRLVPGQRIEYEADLP